METETRARLHFVKIQILKFFISIAFLNYHHLRYFWAIANDAASRVRRVGSMCRLPLCLNRPGFAGGPNS